MRSRQEIESAAECAKRAQEAAYVRGADLPHGMDDTSAGHYAEGFEDALRWVLGSIRDNETPGMVWVQEQGPMVKVTIANGGRLADGTPWFQILRTANGIEDATFGQPEYVGIRDGADHYAEEYPDARVEIRGDDVKFCENQVVTIITKTPKGARLIREASTTLGLTIEEV